VEAANRKELATMQGSIILIGHSVGASIVMKCMSEIEVNKPIGGIFLITTPFWGGNGWRYEGYEELALPKGFATRLPKGASLFLYHSRDDEVVPFAHLTLYAEQLPQATVREFDRRGHQFTNDLVAPEQVYGEEHTVRLGAKHFSPNTKWMRLHCRWMVLVPIHEEG
jgi:predicted alpha/beta hydrolase family esterase